MYRSIGLISNCKLLGSGEAIKALTDLRLGIALGFSDFDIGIVDSLIIMSQKAHIQFAIVDKKIDNVLLDESRSKIIRESLNISN